MPRILLVLPVAAVILVALSVWKATRPPAPPVLVSGSAARLVPKLELFDSHRQLFRLRSRLGRGKILVVFFRAETSFDDSPLLQEVIASAKDLQQSAPVIVAVGPSQSGIYRHWMQDSGDLPFHVVGDVLGEVRRDWGLAGPKTAPLREAVFVIDGAGLIRFTHLEPDLGTPADWIRELRSVR